MCIRDSYWPGPRAIQEIEEAKRRSETAAYIRGFASYLAEELGDPGSYAFYEKLARAARRNAALEDLMYRVLSEVKDDFRRGRVWRSKGAAFTDRLKRACLERELPLF